MYHYLVLFFSLIISSNLVAQTEISELLSTCKKHLQANHLTSGKVEGKNALACYRQVLKRDRTNTKALKGIKQIEERYIKWIKKALKQGKENKAKQYLASLRLVNPTVPLSLKAFDIWLKSPIRQIHQQVRIPRPICKQPNQVFRDRLLYDELGPEMVCIPAGKFQMGDIQGKGYRDEQPVHEVLVKTFAMSRHEVTFEQYDHFAQAIGAKKPDDEGWGRDNRPVIWVSWQDAMAYTEWLSQQTGRHYRLPTEAEWEYAARAGKSKVYGYSNQIGKNRANCAKSGSQWSNNQTAPVGSFAYNNFGLYDIVGNVWEWTCSAYQSRYRGRELTCADKDNQSGRVIRGGSWFLDNRLCRVAARNWSYMDSRYNNVGFRVVAEP
jgi:formylglycine-generating enzyme required for sulfatase activity